MIPLELDVHTHTVASGHYTKDTVTDMLKQAAKQGLKLLGISEHGPALPHACTLSYFRSLTSASSHRMGVHVLYGAEANIMDAQRQQLYFAQHPYTGQAAYSANCANGHKASLHSSHCFDMLDLPEDILKNLDYVIVGMHLPCFKPGTVEENTAAYIKAMENPYVKIIAHPDDTSYPVDYKRLVEAAMDYHVLLEINNASLMPDGYRGDTLENNRMILELCKKYRYPVLLSSDSHGHENVGNFVYALELIKDVGFSEELVLNRSEKLFLEFIGK